MKLRKKQDRSL